MKSKYIITGALIIAAIILVVWAFGPCRKVPSHKEDKKQVDEEIVKVDSAAKVLAKYHDSVIAVIKIKDSAYTAQGKKLQQAERQLIKEQEKANGFASQVITAKANNDTSGYIEGCDALAEQNAQLSAANSQVIDYADSLKKAHDATITSRDNLIAKQQLSYDSLKNSFYVVSTNYNILYSDYKKIGRQSKVERTKTRVAAAVALVAGAFAFFKH